MIQFGVWHFLYFPVLVRKNRPIVRKYKLELKLELKYLVLEGCSSNFASTFTNIALLKNRKLNNKEKVRQIFVAVLVVLSALVGGMTASAQERNDSSIKKCSNIIRSDCDVVLSEGEIFFGIGLPVETYHGGKQYMGINLGLAYRVNIPNTKFDCGIKLDINGDMLRWKGSEYNLEQTNRTVNIMLTGGYNFRQGHKVNPFAEIGMGVGFMDVVGVDVPYPIRGTNFVFSPRIGCEFWSILRVYASSHIIRKGFNSFELGIGLAIGGWRKKR